MRVLALDIAEKLGWAVGDAGAIPLSGSKLLIKKGDPVENGPGECFLFLQALIRQHKPDCVVREAWLDPVAQPSSAAIISQLLLHGAALAICSAYKLPMYAVAVGTWRTHFTGRAHVSKQEKDIDRLANKRMVADRAKLLKYIPRDSEPDFDQCDAIGIWDWGSAHIGKRPSALHLFGGKLG